jgi:hypothetical protein
MRQGIANSSWWDGWIAPAPGELHGRRYIEVTVCDTPVTKVTSQAFRFNVFKNPLEYRVRCESLLLRQHLEPTFRHWLLRLRLPPTSDRG